MPLLPSPSLPQPCPLCAVADDNGYPCERSEQRISPEITAFAGADGRVQVDYPEAVPLNLRVPVPGYQDLTQAGVSADAALKKTAMEQCSFCHQQGSFFMRSEEEWQQVMERMIGYGARPSSEHQLKLIEVFHKGYTDLRQHPEKVLRAKPWETHLAGAQVPRCASGRWATPSRRCTTCCGTARLFEFDPVSKTFTTHYFDDGLYPHTVRIDAQDNVWFTLALSNQVGRFDRQTKSFHTYGLPMHWLSVDQRVTGMPLPYGIDVAPDGRVWFARLHADSIGVIDLKTDSEQVIAPPLPGLAPAACSPVTAPSPAGRSRTASRP